MCDLDKIIRNIDDFDDSDDPIDFKIKRNELYQDVEIDGVLESYEVEVDDDE